jgi:hypothetical protein
MNKGRENHSLLEEIKVEVGIELFISKINM